MLHKSIVTFNDTGNSTSIKKPIKSKKYVVGYHASLIYVMNGLAECVFISESLPRKQQSILTQTCTSGAIPFYTSTDDIKEFLFPEIDVLTVLSPKS